MDIFESSQLSLEDELGHWWIRSRFDYLDNAVRSESDEMHGPLRVLEVGCGTGQNLALLRKGDPRGEILAQLTGVDPGLNKNGSNHAVAGRLGPADQLVSSESEVQGDYDVLVMMDVLEHIEDDKGALGAWVARVKPGGLVFVTVPAFRALWSSHDEILGHLRRYTRRELEETAKVAELIVVRTCYAFSFLFPIAWMMRKVFSGKRIRSDLKKENFLINWMFRMTAWMEHKIGGCPFLGTSVVGVFRKTEQLGKK